MKKVLAFITFMTSAFGACAIDEEAEEIGTEVYIYAYPLVTMEITRRVMTNIVYPGDGRAPMGQFAHLRSFADNTFRDFTAPNADTLYSLAWLDLSKEPYILHVPDQNGRFYLMPMLSGWTEVFADPGNRTTGTKEQEFMIIGPWWKGKIPRGIKAYRSPTNLVWIMGRIFSLGTPEDYKEVHEIQDQYTLTPYSKFGKPYFPPKGTVDLKIDMKRSVRSQVQHMSANQFFTIFAELLKNNPPAPEDAPMVAKMKRIGIIPGKCFDRATIDRRIMRALLVAPQRGIERIMSEGAGAESRANGWVYSLKTGTYGTNYLHRAYVAAIGLGANLPEDAVYLFTKVDDHHELLNGRNDYVLHFSKDQIPPVNAFWSLTLYNSGYYFEPNSLNRFSLGSKDNLQHNPDGSLDIYIQNYSPGADKESNWLPAPEDHFILMLRLYWPDKKVLNGSWKPPAVQKIVR